MAFDITSVLKNVPVPGTGEEQIEYIDLDLIDPDPENFYSLDGLDDLAANIELIGLQQPLRVRPGEGSHVIVVSGHRRRAACLMLRGGGNEKFNRVACIREKDEVSAAMRELRLIYANASTRVMSPAEMSKQAERVETLLYQLKEEGVEFPGRMRDHVAQACQVSKSKLSRLHAIRKNMAPDLLSSCFDAGLMAESVAYELSKQNHDTQRWIVDTYKATHASRGGSIKDLQEWWARDFGKCVKKMAELHCRQTAGGGECIHQREHIEHIWRRGYEGYEGCVNSREGSAPKCCADCDNLASCSVSCPRCEPKKKKLKADIQAQRRSERETKKADEENRKAQKELEESQAALYWARLGGALKDAGIDFWTLQDKIGPNDSGLHGSSRRLLCNYSLISKDIEALLDGKPARNDDSQIPNPFTWYHNVKGAQLLAKMADALGVSLDYLYMRTDDPRTVAAVEADRDPEAENDLRISSPVWLQGDPDHDGRFLCKMLIGKDAKPHEQRMEWKAGGWYVYGDPADKFDMSVQCWWPLPPEV